MMKRLFAFATTKLAAATRRNSAQSHDRTDADTARTDGGSVSDVNGTPFGSHERTDGDDATVAAGDESTPDAPAAPAAETDAETLLYADDDEFEAAFADEWPNLPGESLTWLVEDGETEPLLIGYDRNSDSDDEFLQTPAIGESGRARSEE